jgi:signal transduction histidine kinase
MFVPPLVVLVLAVLVYDAIRHRRQSTRDVQHTYEVIATLGDLRARLADAEAGQRGFLLSGDMRHLRPYEGAARDVEEELANARALTRGMPGQQARLDSLGVLVGQRLDLLRGGIDLRRDGGLAEARAQASAGGGAAVMREIRRLLSTVEMEERRLLAERGAREERRARQVLWILFGGSFLAIVASALTHSLVSFYARDLETLTTDLDESNQKLEEQALELELQSEELQTQATHLQDAMVELETANEELLQQKLDLEETRAELEESNERLERVNLVLRERTTEAEQANRAKSDFLAVMSHELRTPLNAIAGYVQLVEMGLHGPVTERQVEALNRVQRNQTYLLALINDVLNFAKLEAGRLEIRTSDVPVAETLTSLEDLIGPQVRQKNIDYSCIPCDDAVRMRGDRERVEQILINLLTNAAKFTEPGGAVTVSCEAEEERIRISVRDTGRGIAAEKLEEIFDPFVQVGRDADSINGGVGLGLAISHELARSMGGDLTVESRQGEGSTFTLHLPRGHRTKSGNMFETGRGAEGDADASESVRVAGEEA